MPAEWQGRKSSHARTCMPWKASASLRSDAAMHVLLSTYTVLLLVLDHAAKLQRAIEPAAAVMSMPRKHDSDAAEGEAARMRGSR